MKKFLLMFTILSFNVMAEDVVLSTRDVVLPVDISTAKMKLLAADYSMPVVKVLIPALADVTILNHRNTNEGAPCMATYDTLNPEEVIQNNPQVENIPLKVTLFKSTYPSNGRCVVVLTETIEGKIRGFDFFHSENQQMPERHLDDCR